MNLTNILNVIAQYFPMITILLTIIIITNFGLVKLMKLGEVPITDQIPKYNIKFKNPSKKEEKYWSCGYCRAENEKDDLQCQLCSAPKVKS